MNNFGSKPSLELLPDLLPDPLPDLAHGLAWPFDALDQVRDEVYCIDGATLSMLYANRPALHNLQHTLFQLRTLTFRDIFPEYTPDFVAGCLSTPSQTNSYGSALINPSVDERRLEIRLLRRNGTRYTAIFRLLSCQFDQQPGYLLVGYDISVAKAAARAMELSESRYRAIISNIPGLIFQCSRTADGTLHFQYLNEHCEDLLGISSTALYDHPTLFAEAMLPENSISFWRMLDESERNLSLLNWQGQIRIAKWQDTKWVSIRATPQRLTLGTTLWDGVITNITDTKLEEFELKHSRAQLAELSAHIQRVKEEERTRIAREIHDDLGGNLTATKMALGLLKRHLDAADTIAREKMDYAAHLLDRTIDSIHRIAADLRPGVLDFGLVAAIEWQTREFERLHGIPCHFTSQAEDIALDDTTASAIFRIFQEAMTNVSKHAQASEVQATLLVDDHTLTLHIADNGQGMKKSEQSKPDSFGIRGMTERVASLRGDLRIESEIGKGTQLFIQIPLTFY